MLPWVKKIVKNKTTRILFGLFVVFFCVFFFKNVVHAQVQITTTSDTFGVQAVDNSNLVLSGQDIRVVIAKIIRAVLGLLGILTVVIILYAGYEIMLSGGEEEKVTKGKKILTNAIIGLVIILTSFMIVQFILNALAEATGMNRGNGGARAELDSFAGSGALGKIVKDHYPVRDQTDVYRNASIIVTFVDSVPVDPASLIINENNSCWDLVTKKSKINCSDQELEDYPYYGDCVDLNGDGVVSRREQVEVTKPNGNKELKYECDTLNTDAVIISNIDPATNEENIFDAVALSMYENVSVSDGKVNADNYSFVFSPIELLGSPEQNMSHTVRLTNDILNKQLGEEEQQGVFSNQFSRYYEWKFETNTEVDIDPPYVEYVSPTNNESIPKNTIISVQFNEAMNPLMVSGKTDGNDPTSFTNILFNTYFNGVTTTPSGTWKMSNGYTTAEFVPTTPCGLNSCGDLMYCLPLDCPDEDTTCNKDYQALIRTADLTDNKEIPFEAQPFTGTMDTAFNALDSGNGLTGRDGQPQGKPEPGDYLSIDEIEKNPDNFWWSFNVYNKIDREAPYIVKLTPDIDKYSVAEQADLDFYYSKPMWYYTLSNFSLNEYPEPGVIERDGVALVDDSIWYYNRMEEGFNGDATSTRQIIKHRVFGPNDADLYYFPVLPSTIKSRTQNCLYPGRGSDVQESASSYYSLECRVKYDDKGNYESSENCVGVDLESSSDTGCMYIVNRGTKSDNITSSTEECLQKLESENVSPYTIEQTTNIE